MAPFTPLSGVSRWRRVVPGAVRVHLRREVAGPGRGGGGGRGERGGAAAGVGGELPGRAQGGEGAAGGDLREQQPHSQTAGYRWGRQSKNICPLNKHYLCRADPRGGGGRAGAARRAGGLPGHLQRAPHQAHGQGPRPRQGTPQGEPRPATSHNPPLN